MITTVQLESIAYRLGIPIIETVLPHDVRGYYAEGIDGQSIIILSDKLTPTERRCVLAEELGHCMMNVGTPIGFSGHKQELTGRRWAYKQLIPPISIKNAFNAGEISTWDIAQALDVTEEFLCDAINDYESRGISVVDIESTQNKHGRSNVG